MNQQLSKEWYEIKHSNEKKDIFQREYLTWVGPESMTSLCIVCACAEKANRDICTNMHMRRNFNKMVLPRIVQKLLLLIVSDVLVLYPDSTIKGLKCNLLGCAESVSL